MWTRFYDMSSGGSEKLDFDEIYIEADYKVACSVFEEKFDRDPTNVTCICCGPDYSIGTEETLEELTEYLRYDDSLEDYLKSDGIKIIKKEEF